MPYILTEDDITLLEHHTGALNTGRVLVGPAERFGNIGVPASPDAPSVKWSHADELSALALRARAGNVTPPANAQELTPPIASSETRPVQGEPGTIYTMQLGADGRFSVEVSGSPYVMFAVGEKGVFSAARTSAGAGSASPQSGLAGEWGTWKYEAETGGRQMRPQLLLP